MLLAEKDDFAGGASGRSTRMLHCGLRYFETPRPLRDFLFHPARLRTALAMARASMETRAELAGDSAARLTPYTLSFPIWRQGPYRPWHLDLGFRILARLGPPGVPLDYRRLSAAEAQASLPFVEPMGGGDRLHSVASFREYMFDWPERFCIDAILDAERMGATVRNHTEARLVARDGDGVWQIGLHGADGDAQVTASLVLNMAGLWIDSVNRRAEPSARRLVLGTKGAHIAVRLPEAFQGHGIATVNSLGEPHYCLPSQGGLHHIGPTETIYTGDPDDIRVDADDVAFLLAETRHALPGLKLDEADIVHGWAGVRPLTEDPAHPKGNRSREIHDLAADGLPGVLAMTAGPVMSHRSAGRELTSAVARRLAPSRPPQTPDYRPRLPADNANAPALVAGDETTRLTHLGQAAVAEHARDLADILFARTGVGYRHALDEATVRRAGEAVAAHLGWNAAEVDRQTALTLRRIDRYYRLPRIDESGR